jgi:hypothetical protein
MTDWGYAIPVSAEAHCTYSGPQQKQTFRRKIQNDHRLCTVGIFTYYKNNLGRIQNNITSHGSSSKIDANHGKNDRSRYYANIYSLTNLKTYTYMPPQRP